MNKIKVGDKVVLVSGKDKGKEGKVMKLNWKKATVIVEGVNLATKALKPSQENPNGGFIKKENSVSISNILLISPKTGKPTKVGFKLDGDKMVRFAKNCGSLL
jgi:large subunit ribosomal protein L24